MAPKETVEDENPEKEPDFDPDFVKARLHSFLKCKSPDRRGGFGYKTNTLLLRRIRSAIMHFHQELNDKPKMSRDRFGYAWDLLREELIDIRKLNFLSRNAPLRLWIRGVFKVEKQDVDADRHHVPKLRKFLLAHDFPSDQVVPKAEIKNKGLGPMQWWRVFAQGKQLTKDNIKKWEAARRKSNERARAKGEKEDSDSETESDVEARKQAHAQRIKQEDGGDGGDDEDDADDAKGGKEDDSDKGEESGGAGSPSRSPSPAPAPKKKKKRIPSPSRSPSPPPTSKKTKKKNPSPSRSPSPLPLPKKKAKGSGKGKTPAPVTNEASRPTRQQPTRNQRQPKEPPARQPSETRIPEGRRSTNQPPAVVVDARTRSKRSAAVAAESQIQGDLSEIGYDNGDAAADEDFRLDESESEAEAPRTSKGASRGRGRSRTSRSADKDDNSDDDDQAPPPARSKKTSKPAPPTYDVTSFSDSSDEPLPSASTKSVSGKRKASQNATSSSNPFRTGSSHPSQPRDRESQGSAEPASHKPSWSQGKAAKPISSAGPVKSAMASARTGAGKSKGNVTLANNSDSDNDITIVDGPHVAQAPSKSNTSAKTPVAGEVLEVSDSDERDELEHDDDEAGDNATAAKTKGKGKPTPRPVPKKKLAQVAATKEGDASTSRKYPVRREVQPATDEDLAMDADNDFDAAMEVDGPGALDLPNSNPVAAAPAQPRDMDPIAKRMDQMLEGNSKIQQMLMESVKSNMSLTGTLKDFMASAASHGRDGASANAGVSGRGRTAESVTPSIEEVRQETAPAQASGSGAPGPAVEGQPPQHAADANLDSSALEKLMAHITATQEKSNEDRLKEAEKTKKFFTEEIHNATSPLAKSLDTLQVGHTALGQGHRDMRIEVQRLEGSVKKIEDQSVTSAANLEILKKRMDELDLFREEVSKDRGLYTIPNRNDSGRTSGTRDGSGTHASPERDVAMTDVSANASLSPLDGEGRRSASRGSAVGQGHASTGAGCAGGNAAGSVGVCEDLPKGPQQVSQSETNMEVDGPMDTSSSTSGNAGVSTAAPSPPSNPRPLSHPPREASAGPRTTSTSSRSSSPPSALTISGGSASSNAQRQHSAAPASRQSLVDGRSAVSVHGTGASDGQGLEEGEIGTAQDVAVPGNDSLRSNLVIPGTSGSTGGKRKAPESQNKGPPSKKHKVMGLEDPESSILDGRLRRR